MTTAPSVFRYVRTRSGILLLITLILFITAVLQAGVLQNLFKNVVTLRVILPEAGLSGLSSGAPVEVLGTNAGTVRRIVIDPTQNFYALVEINASMKDFIRRDSRVTIKKQFGIAGAAFLDISRGHEEQLDWNYAVLDAGTDRSATDSIGDILADLQKRIYPILDDAQRTIGALARVMEGLERGEGSVGRLARDDTLAKELEAIAVSVRGEIDQLSKVTENLQQTTASTAQIGSMAANRLPGTIDNLNATINQAKTLLASLDKMSRDVGQRIPGAVDSIPALMVQTQQTLAEMERLMAQMRASWLLGGGGGAQPVSEPRLPATEIRP